MSMRNGDTTRTGEHTPLTPGMRDRAAATRSPQPPTERSSISELPPVQLQELPPRKGKTHQQKGAKKQAKQKKQDTCQTHEHTREVTRQEDTCGLLCSPRAMLSTASACSCPLLLVSTPLPAPQHMGAPAVVAVLPAAAGLAARARRDRQERGHHRRVARELQQSVSTHISKQTMHENLSLNLLLCACCLLVMQWAPPRKSRRP